MNTSRYSIFFTVATLWLGHFLVDMMLGIWPIYKTLAHMDLAKAGLIGGICALVGEGLQVLFGSLTDRGYRRVLIFFGLIATAANAFFVYVDEYSYVFALYLVTSIGSGAFHPAAASLMGDLASNRKGLFIALFVSGGSLGMALSQIIFTHAQFHFEGHVAWLALPAVFLTLFAFANRLAAQPSATENRTKRFDVKIFIKFFKNRHLCTLYFVQVCNAALLWGTMFLLPDLLHSRGYEPWIAFGSGHMAFILGGTIMMLPAGYLADRYSSRLVILTASMISMLLFYVLLISPVLSDELTLLLLLGIGASLVVVSPVSIALGASLVPDQKGAVSAFLMGLVWCVSEGIGQGGGGALTKLFEEDAPAKALAILGGLFVICILLAARLPRKESLEAELELDNIIS